MTTTRAFLVLAAGVAALAAPEWVQAGFPELLQRLPSDTNTVVVVNLDTVMKTPLAKQMDWPGKWADAFDAGPTPFPAGTSRALVGAYYLPSKRDAQWKIAMMDMSQEIDLPAVARAEGGYADRIWDKDGVVSPLDCIFIKVQPDQLAGIEPADRPFALKWVQQSANYQGPSSQLLNGIVRSMGASSQITMGMDMTDMFSAPAIRRNMAMAPLQSLGEKPDLDLWCNFLGSIQGVRFDVTITDQIKGRLTANFGINAGMLQANGKAVLIEVLDRAGMSLPDLADWKITTDEKSFTAEGALTPASLREIVNIIGMPAPANTADSSLTQATEDPAIIGKTSSRYFRSISGSIDQIRANGSYQTAKTWLIREAQRIERLPIVNVDPELVAWGGEVSSRLRQAAGSLAYDEQNNVAKVMNVQSAGSYSLSYNGGNGYWGSGSGVSYNNPYQGRGTQANTEWQRQRTQIYQQGKADAIKNVSEIWGKIGADRDKMRAKMVEKYKIEF